MGGDHLILVGRVQRFATDERPPLLFYRGRYATAEGALQALGNLPRGVAAAVA
ncbi:flavin reductase family protein [Aromatoleum toluvorans]|uniref:flavin reductase family protein n=1 Tax=Aromatoleum toluvorans TaxID=92002 RepID=UPI001FE4D66A|nr:flavin reductase family protein [Aromatoleum toluvorans]